MKREYVSVDIAKVIASLFIVNIHCAPFKYVSEELYSTVWIYSNLAVPVFFIFSAYFLFSKAVKDTSAGTILNYVKRICIMYGVWFVIMLPMSVKLQEGKSYTAASLLKKFLFGSPFRGAWFGNFEIYDIFVNLTEQKITQSFMIALIYFAIGKYLAENKEKWQKYAGAGTGLLLMVVIVAYYCELALATELGWMVSEQAAILTPVTTVLIFILVMNWEVKVSWLKKSAFFLRKASTVTYFSHFIFLYLIRDVWQIKMHFCLRYLLIVLLCWGVTGIICMAEKKCRILRYLY